MQGNVTFKNITLDHNDKFHIVAQNHKLVVDTGVTTSFKLDNTGANRIYVYGGYYVPTKSFSVEGDITLRSGIFEFVTAGSRLTDGSTVTVSGGEAKITLGGTDESPVRINRFAPLGVYGGLLDANVMATVTIDGAFDVTGNTESTLAGWYLAVAYGKANANYEYTVDVLLLDDNIKVKSFFGRTEEFTVNYNVYYDARIEDSTLPVAEQFAAVKTAGKTTINTTVDTYYTYCVEKLDGHTYTDEVNTCQTCDTCGYTEHEIASNAVWVKDGDSYTFSCQCGEVKLTADKPYVYVGGYTAGTFTTDEDGKTVRVTDPVYTGENDAIGTLEAPVKTITEAVRRMAQTGGTVYLTATYDIYDDITTLPAYTETVTFTSVLGDDGKALYGFECKKLGACFNMNGPTAFENIKFDMPGQAETTHETTGEKVLMYMTLVFAAHYNDLTFGEGISTLGKAYVVAGTNRLSAAAPEANTEEREITLTFNKVETREDEVTGTSRFYTNIYLGDRVKYIQSDYVLKNKNITAIFNDADCGYVYASTTSPASYQSKTDSGENGDIENDSDDVVDEGTLVDDTDDTTTDDTTTESTYARDIVTLDNCNTTVIFNGESSAVLLNTGHENAYKGSTSLDSLTVYLNGNSTVGATTASTSLAFQLYNVKDLKIYVSDSDDTQEWDGEGTRTVALEKRIHVSLSEGFKEWCAEQEEAPQLKTYIKYSAHTTAVYPRVNYGYDVVDRDYTNDHEFALNSDGTAYVCTVCGKTMADAAMSPVVVTAKPVSAADGKITVEYIISASTHSAYSIKETINSISFNIVAPAGYTLESITGVSLADGTKDQVAGTWVGIVDGNTFTVKCIDTDNTITRTGAMCTATFTYDPTSTETSDVDGFYVTNVLANRLNDTDEIEPAVVYGVASETYTQGFSLGVILKSDYVLEYVLPTNDEVSECWMVFEKNGESSVVYPYEKDGKWRFVAPSIAGKEMNDTIRGTYYYIGTDGVLHIAATKAYNLVTYYSVMKSSEELSEVLAAMFNYGAAAQTYFGYNTDSLVNEVLDEADRVDYTSDTSVTAVDESNAKDVAGQLYTLYSQSAVLEQRILTTLVFKPVGGIDDISALTFKAEYENVNGTKLAIEISGEKVYTDIVDGVTYLCVDIDTVAAKDLRCEFTGALYSGDTQVSQTVTTSFEAYAAKVINSTDDALTASGVANPENLKAVCRAILAYSDAAAKYLKTTEQ